jgi:hypothetical protein
LLEYSWYFRLCDKWCKIFDVRDSLTFYLLFLSRPRRYIFQRKYDLMFLTCRVKAANMTIVNRRSMSCKSANVGHDTLYIQSVCRTVYVCRMLLIFGPNVCTCVWYQQNISVLQRTRLPLCRALSMSFTRRFIYALCVRLLHHCRMLVIFERLYFSVINKTVSYVCTTRV